MNLSKHQDVARFQISESGKTGLAVTSCNL
jgi:hypothetical protein